MTDALETLQLSKRYGKQWALSDCTLHVPVGRVAGLVGPNGAGKTTLLHLAVGLLVPTTGSIKVLGQSPYEQPEKLLSRIGFIAQEQALYRSFSVQDMLTFGQKMNPRWDAGFAQKQVEQLGIPLKRTIGKLSGGQRAQVALVMALAKKPELLLLDEPLASLDPLARRSFEQTLMSAVVEDHLTVLISSHLVGELERICDYLVMLSAAHVQMSSDLEELLTTHKRLIGPRLAADAIARTHSIIQASHTERQSTLLVCMNGPEPDPAWEVEDVSLEEIILAYLAQPQASVPPGEVVRDGVGVSL
ncbi:MAG TPA: ABC transporter ATP-binding protein [Ktedonosporobacter sp.]|nr:ABC transporter ATP-binding protein [Ktedonosporobacter sp.]